MILLPSSFYKHPASKWLIDFVGWVLLQLNTLFMSSFSVTVVVVKGNLVFDLQSCVVVLILFWGSTETFHDSHFRKSMDCNLTSASLYCSGSTGGGVVVSFFTCLY